jgi:hypothetical protein
MARRLRDGADFLDMCARLDKTGELDWTKPIIERRYTIMETMRAAADRIELDEGALATAHEVFAAEIEGLHKIIEMNQPGYKRETSRLYRAYEGSSGVFNWIFFGVLWALSGYVGWEMKVRMFSGGKANSYDKAMFVPSLIVGPVNIVLAIIFGR